MNNVEIGPLIAQKYYGKWNSVELKMVRISRNLYEILIDDMNK